MPERDPNTGHGHVYPRPDGMKARCGGPGLCCVCRQDLAESDPAARLPVACYLPVELRGRGSSTTRWWRTDLEKPVMFTVEDFRPFVLRTEKESDWGVSVRNFHLEVQHVDVDSRKVVCRPYFIAASKADPLHDVLDGCGWVRCDAPKAVP